MIFSQANPLRPPFIQLRNLLCRSTILVRSGHLFCKVDQRLCAIVPSPIDPGNIIVLTMIFPGSIGDGTINASARCPHLQLTRKYHCQDNDISWVDWRWDDRAEALIHFTKRMAALRRRYPVLRQSRFLTATLNEGLGVKGSAWLNPTGEEMKPQDWHDLGRQMLWPFT